MDNPNKRKDEGKGKEIIIVDPKPIIKKVEPANPLKAGNISIGKVGSLTLNVLTKPLKKRYETHYKKDRYHLFIDIALGVVILILLAVLLNLWLYSRTPKINLIDFQVTSNPAQLINGQETEFTFDYTNTTKETLSNVTLTLKATNSLRDPVYSIPNYSLKTKTLVIGDLPPKASGQFTIKGLLIGNFNDKIEFLAVMNYQNKYGQSRQEFFNEKVELADSVLKTEIKLPVKIVASSPFTTQVITKNTSKLDFDNVEIKMLWPDNFTLTSSDLGNPLTDQTWQIGKIKAGETNIANFDGRVYAKAQAELNFGTEIYANYQNTKFLLNKAQNTSIINFSKFNLDFVGQENIQAIAPGGKTNYTVHYKNNENYAVTNVQIGLAVYGDYADQNFLAKTYGKKAKTNQVLFDQNDYPQLAKIEPGQEGTIQVQAGAKTTINFPQYQENGYQLEARGLAAFNDPTENQRLTIEGSAAFTQIDSDLSFSTTALFYTAQGDQIGVGNVPPVVGEYTSYWAIIRATNTNNKIKDLTITAKVPANIEYADVYNVTDGDQIEFDSTSRLLTWHISEVSAFAGIFTSAPEARIQLAITPTSDQVGQSPLLLTNIKGTATDAKTNAFVSASAKDISIAIFPDSSLNKVIK
jgi:hypothetical protein